MNTLESCEEQLAAVNHFFEELKTYSATLEYLEAA